MPIIEVGQKIDGRYLLLELVGEGGMANVYKADDLLEHREVAIKVLKPEFANNQELLRRFKNESRAISVLNHSNIVKVYDVSFRERIQYIAMEYVDGITLKEYIEQRGEPLTYKEVVHFSMKVLDALQHAHDKGIVHRDIKPQNIMISTDGNVKVMDFGIARLTRSESHTATDQAIGSVHYISPEQAQGDVTDLRADIYSTGIMMYEMLTATLPFESDNAVAIALKQISDQAVPILEVNPSVPMGLVDITAKAMAKDPRQRYQSALAMERDIEAFKQDPSIKFAYDFLPDEEPTRYMDKMAKSSQKQTSAKSKAAKKKKSILIPAAIAVTLAVVAVCSFIIFNIFQNSNTPLFGEVEVIAFPSFTNQNIESVVEQLKQPPYQELEYEIKYDAGVSENGEIVKSQIPTPKDIKATQKGIVFHVTSPVEDIAVPDITGKTRAEATKALTDVGLMPYFKVVVDSNMTKGLVVDTQPAAGQAQTNRPGSNRVVVNIAGERIGEKVKVPNLVGLASADAARVALINVKLELVTPVKEEYNEAEAGTIIRQTPEANTEVNEHSTVRITISKGAEPQAPQKIQVPDISGKTEAEANAILASVGLSGSSSGSVADGGAPAGTVFGQSPAAGTEVDAGAAVVYYVSLGMPTSSAAPPAPSASAAPSSPASSSPPSSTPSASSS